MGVPQTIGQFANLADIGDILLAIFDNKFGKYPVKYTRYMNTLDGTRRTETMLGLVGPTALQTMSEGQNTPFEDVMEGYKTQVSIQKWGRGIQFTEEAIRLDRSQRLKNMAENFAESGRYAQETRAARVLNNAITTNHAETGVPLVSNSQPLKRTGGTFDNRIDGDLAVATFEAAMIQFANFVDDNGELQMIDPAYLVHTPNDRRVAKQLLGSDKEPFVLENQINIYRGVVEPIENPWLTDADTSFLLAAPPKNGLYYVSWMGGFRRKAWVDNDPDVLKFKAQDWMDSTFADFRGTVGIIGA